MRFKSCARIDLYVFRFLSYLSLFTRGFDINGPAYFLSCEFFLLMSVYCEVCYCLKMYLLIILIPLINFMCLSCFGRYLGEKGSIFFSVFNMVLTVIFSIFGFVKVGIKKNYCYIVLGDWINSDLLAIKWGFLFGSLTISMFVVVTIISTLVHIYSISYMRTDPHVPRFLSYLSLFTFFMLVLVSADNFLQLFLGWEGVGLCSYLLINFWFTRIQANKSAIKAMVINRLGDFGFFLGVLSIFFIFKTLDFYNVFLLVPYLKYKNLLFLGFECNSLNLIAFLLFIGSVGKSAQVGLHTWLPDAMEGPTPVSALIHAATMVTAGVFLIIRCSILFEYAPTVLMVCVFSGALTAFFAATAGVLQNDVKKVIAYSTCSQLGYMVFACGLSNYAVSFFHLFNHAFFKALLFLAAGSLIHSLSNEQDMRSMGGLLYLLPYTYAVTIAGSFALMGFPFLAGFYSKDIILEIALVNYTVVGKFAYILGTISAFFTSFYSFRVLFLVFIGPNNSFKFFINNLHELDQTTAFVLTVLAFGSVFSGYLFKDLFIGLGSDFFNLSIYARPDKVTTVDSEFIPYYLKLIPTIFSLFGALTSGVAYCILYKYILCLNLTTGGLRLYKFFNQKWYFDFIYNKFIVVKLLDAIYNFVFKNTDKGALEFFGPRGVSYNLFVFMQKLKTHQTGFLHHYTCMLLIGFIFLTYFLI